MGIASFCLIEGYVQPAQLVTFALLGALLGDQLGFWLGRAVGPNFHHSQFASRHASKIAKAEQLITRWGAVAVPIGRFIPAIRSVIPALLGVSGFDARRYLLIDFVSCLAWSIALLWLSRGIDWLLT